MKYIYEVTYYCHCPSPTPLPPTRLFEVEISCWEAHKPAPHTWHLQTPFLSWAPSPTCADPNSCTSQFLNMSQSLTWWKDMKSSDTYHRSLDHLWGDSQIAEKPQHLNLETANKKRLKRRVCCFGAVYDWLLSLTLQWHSHILLALQPLRIPFPSSAPSAPGLFLQISPAPRERLRGFMARARSICQSQNNLVTAHVMHWHRGRHFPNTKVYKEVHHRSSSSTIIHHHVSSFVMVHQSMSHHFWRRISEMIFVISDSLCSAIPSPTAKRDSTWRQDAPTPESLEPPGHVSPHVAHILWSHSSHVTSQYGEIEDAWKQGKSMRLSIDCCAGTLKLDRSHAQSCCATSRAELHPSTSSHFPLSPCAFDVLVSNCPAEVLGKTQPSASGRRTRSVCASRSSRNKLTKTAKQGSNMDKKDVNTHVKSHSLPMHGDLYRFTIWYYILLYVFILTVIHIYL